MVEIGLASGAQLVGAFSGRPKCYEFDSPSGPITTLQVQSPVGACVRKQPIYLSHINVCLSLCLSLSLSLSLPSSLSKSIENLSLGEDKKKKK